MRVRTRSGDGHHRQKVPRDQQEGPQVRDQINEAHGWAQRYSSDRTTDRHISTTAKMESPGLSLNRALKPMGRGHGWRFQVRLIKAHY